MNIDIVWPEPMSVPAAVIVQWFVDAVSMNQIPSDKIRAVTVQEMAQALENIGWIHLARQ